MSGVEADQKTRPEQTNLEMERGRLIASRAKRLTDLNRYIQGGKVKIMVALQGHPDWVGRGQVNLVYVDGVQIGVENTNDDEYPSENLMAKIALAVGATVGFEGIPPAQRQLTAEEISRREFNKEHLINWKEKPPWP